MKIKIFFLHFALNTIFKKFENQKKVFIITVDSPLCKYWINKKINESNDFDICVAKQKKLHNLCGVFLQI